MTTTRRPAPATDPSAEPAAPGVLADPTRTGEPTAPSAPSRPAGSGPGTSRTAVLSTLAPSLIERLFGPSGLARLPESARLVPAPSPLDLRDLGDPAVRSALAEAELLLTGWGTAPLTAEVLDAAPRLRAVVHTAGSVRGVCPDPVWERGLAVASSVDANALPVAEFTVAMVLLSGKRAFRVRDAFRAERRKADWAGRFPGLGNYRARVGLVSASRIGRRVADLLRPFDLEVTVHDPHPEALKDLPEGTRTAGLREVFATSDVVSLHTPLLPATTGMVDAELLALMPDGATLINTARGGVADHAALEAELTSGRISAVLDVTDPQEPLPADSPLWELPNVVLTPHLAGSAGNELLRLGDYALEEIEHFAAGRMFARPIRQADIGRSA